MTFATKYKKLGNILTVLTLLGLCGCSSQDGPEDLISITDPTGATVAGTVRNTAGETGADAIITLEPLVAGRAASVATRTGLASDILAAKSLRTTVADAAGQYAIGDLKAGDYLLTTSLRNHAGATSTFTISEASAALAETTVVDIQLLPTGTILGNATRENATDHSGTVVFVDGTSYVAVTDDIGDYSLTGVPIGLRPVHATAPGYLDDATTATLVAAGDSTTASNLFLRLSANMPPIVDTISASTVVVGNATDLNGDGHDPDGSVLGWEWDFENDGIFDTSSAVDGSASHIYPAPGQYLAKLRLTDNQGAYGLAVVDVTVADLPATAVYVSESGNDLDAGSFDEPVRTIAQGLALAQASAIDSVYVSTGEFPGVVDLRDGIGIYGGRDPVTWNDTPGYSHVTGDTRPLRGTSINTNTRVEGLHIESSDAVVPGSASVAVSLVDCGSQLVFEDCIVTAGNGAPGTSGFSGSNGSPGNNGGSGQPGECDSVPLRFGASGGGGYLSGGNGGNGGNSGGNGSNGGNGASGVGAGGSGGSGGSTGSTGSNANNGQSGVMGTSGAGGGATPAPGSIVGGLWNPATANSGNSAQGGSGGGGGGGGGGQDGTFVIDGVGGAGGGGGGGGFPGQPGTGGQGGGASIGFLLQNATPIITNCTINRGSGGMGGTGGNGGQGGQGGQGGNGGNNFCGSDVGSGGDGGTGGNGGRGGGGAGGTGGPSYGIVGSAGGGVADVTGITFVGGFGGQGGAGGSSTNSGSPGLTGPVTDQASI